jgi:hypothetical protein
VDYSEQRLESGATSLPNSLSDRPLKWSYLEYFLTTTGYSTPTTDVIEYETLADGYPSLSCKRL